MSFSRFIRLKWRERENIQEKKKKEIRKLHVKDFCLEAWGN